MIPEPVDDGQPVEPLPRYRPRAEGSGWWVCDTEADWRRVWPDPAELHGVPFTEQHERCTAKAAAFNDGDEVPSSYWTRIYDQQAAS